MSDFYIGKRLSFGGDLCTVRYIGAVAGTKGDWLGVEWDGQLRGKHSGEANGVKYFECLTDEPLAASFVRPSRPADHPRTFLEALKFKYAWYSAPGHDAKESPGSQQKPIVISGKEVEEIGFEKIKKLQSRLNELRIVYLDGLLISQPRPANGLPGDTEISNTCPKINTLDLARNLVESLAEVAYICQNLRQLRELRLNGNRFRSIGVSRSAASAFKGVQSLSLEATLLKWDEILNVCSCFGSLAELALSSNQLSILPELPNEPRIAQTLTTVHVSSNRFTAISDLRPLADLPNLNKLVVNHCKIRSISSEPRQILFSKTLTHVELAFNDIAQWEFVDRLPEVFIGLEQLRISHNPLFQQLRAANGRPLSEDDGYMLTVAHLGTLRVLNYSPITEKDREDAELYYLSEIGKEISLSPPQLEGDIISKHRRYSELCAMHGDPTVERDQTSNPRSLARDIIKVEFRVAIEVLQHGGSWGEIEREPSGTDYTFEKEIPKRMTMYTVFGVVSKRLGILPHRLRLSWITDEWEFQNAKTATANMAEWDSEDSDEETADVKVKREVPLELGTKSLGTCVDGQRVLIKVLMEQSEAVEPI